MKQSKIQLVELTLGKVFVVPNNLYRDPSREDDEDSLNLDIQSAKTICKSPEFWDGNTSSDEQDVNHTYTVKLGIRTPPNLVTGYPYKFEVQYSGVIVNFDPADGNPNDMAAKYGLALLYGAIRDQIFALTSKMKSGPLLIPTMAFDDADFESMHAAHQRLLHESKKKVEGQENDS